MSKSSLKLSKLLQPWKTTFFKPMTNVFQDLKAWFIKFCRVKITWNNDHIQVQKKSLTSSSANGVFEALSLMAMGHGIIDVVQGRDYPRRILQKLKNFQAAWLANTNKFLLLKVGWWQVEFCDVTRDRHFWQNSCLDIGNLDIDLMHHDYWANGQQYGLLHSI